MPLLVVLLAIGQSLVAAKKAPKVAPMPRPPELEQLRYFVGEWQCAAKGGSPLVRLSVKWDLDKSWFAIRRNEPRSDGRSSRETAGFWGWDGLARQFLRVEMANGGDWSSATASGWSGDDWVWSGDQNEAVGKRLWRTTLTQHGTKEFTEHGETFVDGQWRANPQDLSCTR